MASKKTKSVDLDHENDLESPILNHSQRSGFDIAFNYIPPISWYQTVIVFLGLYLEIPAGAIQLGAVILQADPDRHTCISSLPDNTTFETDDCSSYNESCTEYLYELNMITDTVVTEWDLVCDRSYINSNLKSFGLFGFFFGAVGFGYLADRIGRKKSLLISAIGSTIFSIAVAFLSFNYFAYSIFRFLAGGFIHGSLPITLIYAMELVGSEYRAWVGAANYILFDVGVAVLSPIAFFFPTWKMMAFMLSILPLPFILMYFFMPESIQFLYSSGRTEEGHRELVNLMTNTNTDTSNAARLSAELSHISEQTDREDASSSFIEIWSPTYRLVTLQSCAIFFCACLGNYGFLLNPASLSGNLLLNNIYMAFFDALGYFLTGYFLNKMGRVRLLKLTFFLTGFFIISSAVISLQATDENVLGGISKALVFMGKICNSMSFGATFNFVAELFPTHLRGTAVGVGSASARLGGLLAPQIIQLQHVHQVLPSVCIGIFSLLAALVSYFMPETNDNPLMQSTDEAKQFYERCRSKPRKLL